MWKRYIGDRAFYRRIFTIALPIIIQNAIMNLVSLLDNIMVGQLDNAAIGGVSIINSNLMFIFNICMFGAAAGAGIFTTQFRGSNDQDGIRHTFRFKLILCGILCLLTGFAFYFYADPLINLYLTGEGGPELAAQTLARAREYLIMMIWGMLPFAITNAYASTLRECGMPKVPMVASLAATCVNLVGNYILIFGHFGAPQMGVRGAALATVVSRYVETTIVVVWTHTHREHCPYAKGLYRSAYIPGKLLGAIAVKGTPLLINEFFWTIGMASVNLCYSTRGQNVVVAMSIFSTIYNLAAVVFRSLGNTVGIFMGQMMGAKRPAEEIKDTNRKMLVLAAFSGVVFGLIVAAVSGLFPMAYNTTSDVRHLATQIILIAAVLMPLQAYTFPMYFTMRAGGKTVLTSILDCGTIWALYLPTAFLLTRFTDFSILIVFAACNSMDLIKAIVGRAMIKSGTWIQNLAGEKK